MSTTMLNSTKPDWQLGEVTLDAQSDFQVVLEGEATNGGFAVDQFSFNSAKCETKPSNAGAECTFDWDFCTWQNTTTGDFEWRMATPQRRPANLPDKTYGASEGYAYFDIFSSIDGTTVSMVSPTIYQETADHMCFRFWFAAFGAGDTTSLTIYRQDVQGVEDHANNHHKVC